MSYVTIKNFKAGLDRRGSVMDSAPGTLWTLENAIVDSGGRIIKNFDLQNVGTATINGAESRGLALDENSLLVFSSDTTALGNVATVQILKHPEFYQSGVYVAARHNLDEIVSVCIFAGKAFVVAKFDDGNSFCYYDGTPVEAFYAGYIFEDLVDPLEIATNLKNLLDKVPGLNVSVAAIDSNNAKVDVIGTPGVPYAIDLTHDSDAGGIDTVRIDEGTAGTPGTASTAQFTIHAMESGGQIDNVTADGIDIMDTSSPVTWKGSIELTAAAVATAINQYVPGSGNKDYEATSDGQTVFVYAVASKDVDDINGLELGVEISGNIVVGECSFDVTGGSGSNILSQITADPSGTPQTLFQNSVTWATSDANFAELIAAEIRGYSGTSLYTAVAVNNRVYISKTTTASDDSDVTLQLDYGATGDIYDEAAVTDPVDPFPLVVSAAVDTVEYPLIDPSYSLDSNAFPGKHYTAAIRTPTTIGLSIGGGTEPYRGTWVPIEGDAFKRTRVGAINQNQFVTSGIYWDSTASTWLEPVFRSASPGPVTAKFKLSVMDSRGVPKLNESVELTVIFRLPKPSELALYQTSVIGT